MIIISSRSLGCYVMNRLLGMRVKIGTLSSNPAIMGEKRWQQEVGKEVMRSDPILEQDFFTLVLLMFWVR